MDTIKKGSDVKEKYDIKITVRTTIPELRIFLEELRRVKGIYLVENGAIIIKPTQN